ncbi:hypothetical protein N177_2436 [Lutibaculum baratangense AMV1]|uniref:Uncharacterized protein n=1 Tax=Lutibaculum baratangense AMV1 TaxID=631454 RepID=V4QXX3_9HYPH|nr:hypothetical protein N177_2436 [Lutibaculum baratangense AMV1]
MGLIVHRNRRRGAEHHAWRGPGRGCAGGRPGDSAWRPPSRDGLENGDAATLTPQILRKASSCAT